MKLSEKKRLLREQLLSKENLGRLYITQGWSAKQIADHFRALGDDTLTATAVIKRLRVLGFSSRTVAESVRQKEARKRVEETNIQKYGAINPLSKGTTAFQKKNITVLERYGVSNVRQSPEVIERIKNIKKENGTLGNCNPAAISAAFQRRLSDPVWSAQFSQTISEKAKKRWLETSDELKKKNAERLGRGHEIWWQNLDPADRRVFLQKAGFVSKLESEFFDLVETQTGLKVIRQEVIEGYRYAFDGRIESTKILLEVNGTFFHADPRIYAETDELRFPDKQIRTAQYIWNKDFDKQQAALQQGYRIIVFWEKDIRETPEIELGRLWREYADYVDQKSV